MCFQQEAAAVLAGANTWWWLRPPGVGGLAVIGDRSTLELGSRKVSEPTDKPPARTANLDDSMPSRRSIRRFTVSVIADHAKGQSVRSIGERIAIGRHKTAELVLRDESVSQFHCEIEVQADRLVIRDLGSTNGTQLDGVTIREAYAQPGSILEVVRTKIRIDVGEERVGLPSLPRERFQQIVGRSPPMQELYAVLERAAQSESTLLIEGETGSGKEAVAESVHLVSPRSKGPFHVVDCGAVPATLLEAELFGYERGAFTGAHTDREGIFEAAHGGTVFLDEIGELALELQPKLLRVLEKREVKRIGSTKYFPVNCRILAATLRDLRASVNDRTFRADLFYRLAVVVIRVPPLRARGEDIPYLVEHFLEELKAQDGQV